MENFTLWKIYGKQYHQIVKFKLLLAIDVKP